MNAKLGTQFKSTSLEIYIDSSNNVECFKPKCCKDKINKEAVFSGHLKNKYEINKVSSKYLWANDPNRENFEKSIKENVFIESYYPRLLSSCYDEQSVKSSYTLGTKTYTLYSCCSNSILNSDKFKINNLNCKTNKRESRSSFESPVGQFDCFTNLHTRIEILENLLANILGTPQEEIDISVGHHLPTSNEKNSDTDEEIHDIKKRLSILEIKLGREQNAIDFGSGISPRRTDQELNGDQKKNTSCCMKRRTISSREDVDDLNATFSVHKDEEKLLKDVPGGKDSRLERNKNREDFVTKLRVLKRKCSRVFDSRKSHKIKDRENGMKLSDERKSSTELKQMSEIVMSGVYRTQPNNNDVNEASFEKLIFLKNQQRNHQFRTTPLPFRKRKTLRKHRFSRYLVKKNSKPNVFICEDDGKPKNSRKRSKRMRCENHQTSAMYLNKRHCYGKIENKNGKKGDTKCRNFMTCVSCFHCLNKSFPTDKVKYFLAGDKEEDSKPSFPRPYYGVPVFCPELHTTGSSSQQKYVNSQNEFLRNKRDKNELSRSPLNVLKSGKKIKIPVLFEEICRTDKKKNNHRMPNISMKFVLVQEDKPTNPLRKLIKKLSRTKPPNKCEQYVFGVTKCCCDCDVPTMVSF
ncbi:hypothetical protein RUM44_005536 [Polyplax serrata]|uniref:Uncharacterized protein n=1 Tax=Polyplax serrata TaxID=468196 RepID=A0ABR1ADP1_POLSC